MTDGIETCAAGLLNNRLWQKSNSHIWYTCTCKKYSFPSSECEPDCLPPHSTNTSTTEDNTNAFGRCE
jgi:hypothetical protein